MNTKKKKKKKKDNELEEGTRFLRGPGLDWLRSALWMYMSDSSSTETTSSQERKTLKEKMGYGPRRLCADLCDHKAGLFPLILGSSCRLRARPELYK